MKFFKKKNVNSKTTSNRRDSEVEEFDLVVQERRGNVQVTIGFRDEESSDDDVTESFELNCISTDVPTYNDVMRINNEPEILCENVAGVNFLPSYEEATKNISSM